MKSLRNKLFVSIVCLALFPASLLAYLLYQNHSEQVMKELREFLISEADALVESSSRAPMPSKGVQLDVVAAFEGRLSERFGLRVAGLLFEQKQVEQGYISRSVVQKVDAKADLEFREGRRPASFSDVSSETETRSFRKHHNSWLLERNSFDADQDMSISFKVRLDSLHLTSVLLGHFWDLYGFLAMLMLATVAAFAFLIAHLTWSPLNRLALVALRLGQGDFRYRFGAKRNDELGLLQTSLNIMSETVEMTKRSLQEQTKRLEASVSEKTEEIEQDKAFMKSILDSSHDGILVVDENLKVGAVASMEAMQLLGQENLEGRDFLEVLFAHDGEHQSERRELRNYLVTAFNLFVPDQFDVLMQQAPAHLKINASDGVKLLEIRYAPIIAQGRIVNIVITLADETTQVALQNVEEYAHRKTMAFFDQLHQLSQDPVRRIALSEFINDTMQSFQEIHGELESYDLLPVNTLLRQLHTIKGNARSLCMDPIAILVHAAESNVQKCREDSEQYTEFDFEELLSILHCVDRGVHAIRYVLHHDLHIGMTFTSRWKAFTVTTTRSLQDLARQGQKAVDIRWNITEDMGDEDFLVMRRVLIHLLRNSVDHGIETTLQREQADKEAVGLIEVEVKLHSGEWLLSVSDDGQGINRAMIRDRARQRGLPAVSEEPDDRELLKIMCHPGFSSRDDITDISGRGVGMDVVAEEIRTLGGQLYLETSSERGTTFHIKWPQHDAETHALSA